MQRTKLTHRPLLRPRLLHAGLIADGRSKKLRVRPRARVARDRRHQAVLRPVHQRRVRRRRTATSFKTINPATEEVLAEVAEADEADVDRAVQGRPPRLHTRLVAGCRGRERAQVPLPDRPHHPGARPASSPCWSRSTTASRSGSPATSTSRSPRRTSSTTPAGPTSSSTPGFGADPQPLGVAGQVIPWNFPLLMLAWKIAPALACGNTVVLKPAETTPLTALLFAEICQQADLPPGVVNIVTGAGDDRPRAGRRTRTSTRSPSPARPRSARRSPSAVAGTDKKVTLELGGKAANIVFDDAPIDQAVEGIVNGIFFNQGHVCCAGSRLLVQESVADEVLERAQAPDGHAARRRPAGQEHRHRRDQLRRAAGPDPRALRHRRGRGRRAAGRRRASCPTSGFWFPPTIFTGVTQAHRIAREEIFGPVLSVLTFRTPAEAVEKANNTPYGLSAGVWTDKGSRILLDGQPAARRRGVGQHVQQVRPDQPVRRLQGVGLRPRGRPPSAGRPPASCRSTTAAGSPTIVTGWRRPTGSHARDLRAVLWC